MATDMIFRKKHRDLDKRLAEAQEEKELSEARLEEIRENIVKPLATAGEHNQFAELLRAAISEGYRKPK